MPGGIFAISSLAREGVRGSSRREDAHRRDEAVVEHFHLVVADDHRDIRLRLGEDLGELADARGGRRRGALVPDLLRDLAIQFSLASSRWSRRSSTTRPPGTLVETKPPGGTKVAAKSKVTLDRLGRPASTSSTPTARTSCASTGPTAPSSTRWRPAPPTKRISTWAADGEHVAYTSDGRVMLKDLTKKNSAAVPLTPAGREFADTAGAPTADRNVIAMDEVTRDGQGFVTDTDLCFGDIKSDGTDINCIKEPRLLRHPAHPLGHRRPVRSSAWVSAAAEGSSYFGTPLGGRSRTVKFVLNAGTGARATS